MHESGLVQIDRRTTVSFDPGNLGGWDPRIAHDVAGGVYASRFPGNLEELVQQGIGEMLSPRHKT
jgi:hypothetical protein